MENQDKIHFACDGNSLCQKEAVFFYFQGVTPYGLCDRCTDDCFPEDSPSIRVVPKAEIIAYVVSALLLSKPRTWMTRYGTTRDFADDPDSLTAGQAQEAS